MKLNFKPFPELATENLLLRQTIKTDRKEVFFLRSDKKVNKYIKRKPTNSLKEAEDFVDGTIDGWENGRTINWSILFKGNPRMIGSICLWNFSPDGKTAEVGYDLNPAFQNRGLMGEALQAVLTFGFATLHLFKIEAFTNYRNENSKKLLVGNGFCFMENRKDMDDPDNLIFEIKRQAYCHPKKQKCLGSIQK